MSKGGVKQGEKDWRERTERGNLSTAQLIGTGISVYEH